MLEERLAVSFSGIGAPWRLGGNFEGEEVFSVSCGAVTDLDVFMGTGRVGVFKGSQKLGELSCASLGVCTLSSVTSLLRSSSVLSALLDSDSVFLIFSLVVEDSFVFSSSIDFGRSCGFQGLFRTGVEGGSGRSTVKPLLKGHGVSSYCSTFARTSLSSSAFSLSHDEEFGSSMR